MNFKQIARTIKPITKNEAMADLEKLNGLTCNKLTKKTDKSTTGNKFLDYYFFVHRLKTTTGKGMNFFEFLKTDKILQSKSLKSFRDYYKRIGSTISDMEILYAFFRLYFGSVNQFKPVIAKHIYCLFNPTSILDFSAGWGGRMLGAISLGIPYTGVDTNTSLKKSYEQVIKVTGAQNTKIIFKDSLKVDYSKLDYDMVFTSPPYYTLEKYENMPDYKDFDDWLNNWYFPVVAETYKHLKKGGHYILNVPINLYKETIKILGKADKKRQLFLQKRSPESQYKEYIYIWNKN